MNSYNSFYKTVKGSEGEKCYYPTRLDTYGKGCFNDCKYCYAKQLLDFRKLWNPTDVGIAPIDKIKKTIDKIPEGSVIRMGGMTDCFQPIEREIKNSFKTIEMLNKKNIHYLIVTKSSLIGEKEYLDVLDKNLAHIQISIPSNDNNILKQIEKAETFEKRKETIEKLESKDFDISLRLSPFLYEKSNFDVINSIDVTKCLVEFLRIKPSMADNFESIIDFTKYEIKEGGYRHLPLNEKEKVIEKLDFEQITVCDDVNEHYEYFKKYVNYNKNDCCNLSM